jgi:hypothetical protein
MTSHHHDQASQERASAASVEGEDAAGWELTADSVEDDDSDGTSRATEGVDVERNAGPIVLGVIGWPPVEAVTVGTAARAELKPFASTQM